MRSFVIWVNVFLFGIAASAAEPSQLLDALEEKYSQTKQESGISASEKIEQLGYIVQWIGKPESHQDHAARARTLQHEAQTDLIAIPGHAEYFKTKIESQREQVKISPLRPTPERDNYDKRRYVYLIKILGNTPSSEAVRVLGYFLADETGSLPREPGQDWAQIGSNADLAVVALTSLGIRNAPLTVFRGTSSERDIWRSWYEEIKSGKRAFSFEGQNVEYRFNPDGSVTTTPIAVETRPTPEPRKPEVIQRMEATPPAVAVQPYRRLWIVVGLIVTGLIAAIALWRKGRKSH